jgi:hypothetical protein
MQTNCSSLKYDHFSSAAAAWCNKRTPEEAAFVELSDNVWHKNNTLPHRASSTTIEIDLLAFKRAIRSTIRPHPYELQCSPVSDVQFTGHYFSSWEELMTEHGGSCLIW